MTTQTVMLACGHVANGVNADGEPVCVICAGIDPRFKLVADEVDLTDRTARCSCGQVVPSSRKLAFFEFRGEGSRSARETCKHCRYAYAAHVHDEKRVRSSSVIERGECPGFEPTGAWEYDAYYCGHGGWD